MEPNAPLSRDARWTPDATRVPQAYVIAHEELGAGRRDCYLHGTRYTLVWNMSGNPDDMRYGLAVLQYMALQVPRRDGWRGCA
jgi:hypothetical protein